jgi:hypothetical protein
MYLHCDLLDRVVSATIILKVKSFVTTLALGLQPRQRGLQGYGTRGSPGVAPHAPESVGKCERMNPHTPKATPTLGDGVPVDSRIFREQLQGSKLNGLRSSLYHWKNSGTYMYKMGSHEPFEHLKQSYGQKKGRESN